MKEFDFLFIYEHKVRELENLCLMKYELDRRGYKLRLCTLMMQKMHLQKLLFTTLR